MRKDENKKYKMKRHIHMKNTSAHFDKKHSVILYYDESLLLSCHPYLDPTSGSTQLSKLNGNVMQ